MIVWKLHGICFKEMAEVAEMLATLAEYGEIEGTKFDLDTLEIHYDENNAEVNLVDGEGNTTKGE